MPRAEPTCSFCDIVRRADAPEPPAHIVDADAHTIAFLDRRPLFAGHVLLIPRAHYETLPDLPPAENTALFAAARRLAAAVPVAMGAQGTFIALNNKVSQSIPHLHVHIVPRTRGDGLKGFFWPRTKYRDDAHMADTARRILCALQQTT